MISKVTYRTNSDATFTEWICGSFPHNIDTELDDQMELIEMEMPIHSNHLIPRYYQAEGTDKLYVIDIVYDGTLNRGGTLQFATNKCEVVVTSVMPTYTSVKKILEDIYMISKVTRLTYKVLNGPRDRVLVVGEAKRLI